MTMVERRYYCRATMIACVVVVVVVRLVVDV
jgi:hypothetical protein